MTCFLCILISFWVLSYKKHGLSYYFTLLKHELQNCLVVCLICLLFFLKIFEVPELDREIINYSHVNLPHEG